MATYPFFVRPLEPLYFGPPSSFSAGEAHRGASQFPPSPQTFQGLVRGHLLLNAQPPIDLGDWSPVGKQARAALVGEPDSLPDSWQLEGPFPAEVPGGGGQSAPPSLRLWFRTPRFLLRREKAAQPAKATAIASTHPVLDDLGVSGANFCSVGVPGAVEAFGGWVGSSNLLWALAGEGGWQPEQHHGGLPPFVRCETQAGVAIDRDTAAARPGMLYFVTAVRFRDGCGLVGRLDGEFPQQLDPSCLHRSVAGAGRRRRAVGFEPRPGVDPAWERLRSGGHLPAALPDGTLVWVVLLTPARLDDALRPGLSVSGGVRATVCAALLGQPQVVGGFSLVRGRVRENRTFVPEGSCWLVRLTGGSDQDRGRAVRQWNAKHLWGSAAERAFGFGQVLVGIASKQDNQSGES